MNVPAYDWPSRHRVRTPARTAVVDLHSGRSFTYAELDARSGRLAWFLRERCGVARGDRVAMLAQNGAAVFELQFACGRLGAVFVPLNWRLSPRELEEIARDAAPTVLVHDRELSAAAGALAQGASIGARVELDATDASSGYERAVAEAGGELRGLPLHHDEVSTLLYTSGTTGRPKGVMITHGMTFWNAVNMGLPALVDGRTVFLAVLPTFHTGGLNCFASIVLHAGGTVLVMRAFDPGAALALLADRARGITHFFGVPAHYLFMSQHPDFAGAALSHLVTAGVGGAPAPLPLLQRWADKGVPLQQGYGLTETGPTVLLLDADRAVAKAGTAGVPVMHVEVRLVGEDGRDVAAGQIGEIWVRGPAVTPGYWNQPESTAAAFSDGWLRTGDAARVDADGYYTIVDRWKDMYISGGENVYPAEVENVLHELPGLVEAAVIGVPHPRFGEVGHAVVVLRAGTSLGEAEIVAHCRGRLAAYKVPRSVEVTSALPRNAAGKVLKRELRARR